MSCFVSTLSLKKQSSEETIYNLYISDTMMKDLSLNEENLKNHHLQHLLKKRCHVTRKCIKSRYIVSSFSSVNRINGDKICIFCIYFYTCHQNSIESTIVLFFCLYNSGLNSETKKMMILVVVTRY